MRSVCKEFCQTVTVDCRVSGETVPLDAETGLPGWIQLTPKQTQKGFAARDGRRFKIEDLKGFVAAFNATGEHLLIDIDHASEMIWVGDTSAIGWVTTLALRHGSEIWGKVEWNASGSDLLRNRTYRSISPTFEVTRDSAQAFWEDPQKAEPMRVVGLSSVAVTNKPALRLRSLNTHQGTSTMNRDEIIALLGLSSDATDDDIKAAMRRAPTAADAVPRSDYEALRARNAELERNSLAQRQAAEKERDDLQLAQIDQAIDAAVKAGKITPAGADFHRSTCKRGTFADRAAALAAFNDYVAAAPCMVPTQETPRPTSVPAAKETNADSKKIAKLLGTDPAAVEKARAHIRDNPEIYPPHRYGV